MPSSPPDALTLYDEVRREATALAGGIHDLAQRASVYHHLFQHSGRNHVFPLLAAHGALWARGHFQAGMRLGAALSLAHLASPLKRKELMRRLAEFADKFRDINRRVCVETYAIYHLSGRPELSFVARDRVPAALLDQMLRCHAARRAGRDLSPAEKRSLFAVFFLWEQENIVGPSVERAFAEFDWPLMKTLALRPTVRFAYFRRFVSLPFADFNDTAERVERGLHAFDAGALVGWPEVERAMRDYGIMPESFFEDAAGHFARTRDALCPPRKDALALP